MTKLSPSRLRTAVLLLFFGLWVAVLTLSASASFSDVTEELWFYDDVTTLEQAGILDGYPDGSFRPGNPVSYAEAMKMILGAADYIIEDATVGPWYQPYLDYAAAQGIIDTDTGIGPDDPISRDRAAELIVRAMSLPLDVDTVIRPFADSRNIYAITLHSAGIIRGEMSGGLFYYRGERSLNRAELATIVARMMRRADEPEIIPEHPLLPTGIGLPDAPRTVEDFAKMLIYLSVMGRDEHTFIYRGVDIDTVTTEFLPNLTPAYRIATDLCRESVIYYQYYSITFAYARNYVAMTVRLRGVDYTAVDCRAMFDLTVAEGKRVSTELLAGLTPGTATPEREYAAACLDWIVAHCRYGESEGLMDQYAYSVFRDGVSVCSGYTAAYNLLLKLGGVKCMSMTGDAVTGAETFPHAWTIAELDGETVWIDATWCDPIGQAPDVINRNYFALDEATFAVRHTPMWDYTQYWYLLD